MGRRRLWLFIAAALMTRTGAPSYGDDVEQRIQELEKQVTTLQQELHSLKETQRERATTESPTRPIAQTPSQPEAWESVGKAQDLLKRVTLTGYGSIRFESNSLKQLEDTFTYRRFTFDVDAEIASRLRYFMELEFPRFRKLEFDNSVRPTAGGGLSIQQSVVGTDKSTITLEQAWMEYDVFDWLSIRGGAVFVPLGRFNLHPGDKNWLLPRRSLVDRGVSVLPSPSAWDELGIGVRGSKQLPAEGRFDYQFYVVNGVALDPQLQTVLHTQPGKEKLTAAVSLKPATGTFSTDSKSAKALTGRVAWLPVVGQELAGSFYWGRYTPQFLADEDVWSVGVDGLTHIGRLELEGEYIFTHFEGLKNVAHSFAQVAQNRTAVGSTSGVDTMLQFDLTGLASEKHGYWLEARYPFWPAVLHDTVLAQGFSAPQLIPVLRWEQVWLPRLLKTASFAQGALSQFATESRFVHRVTAGLVYRPVASVTFSLAYEFTWTNNGKSLASVTNFLPAQAHEDHAHAVLFGMVFGFSS